MFDENVFVETGLTLADPNMSGIMKLRAAIQLQTIGAAVEAQIIADMAVASGWDGEDDSFTYNLDPAGRCWVRVGADGVLLDEALPLEIAVAKHISVTAATGLVKDIVDLSTRHPGTWKAVKAGQAPVWQARRVAQTLNRYEFTRDQAVSVDKQVAPLWGRYPYRRLNRVLQAAIMTVTPDVAAQQAARLAEDRFVHRDQGDDPACSYICARLDTADAVFLDATVDRLADLLGAQGDTRGKDHRRASALGVLATPALALSILGVHTRRGLNPDDPDPAPITRRIAETALPTCQVFVHLYADQTGFGPIARVEDRGPVLKTQLARLVGHSRIRLAPVIHVGSPEPCVDAYEIPDKIREHVTQRDIYEVFPYSARNARRQDMDHTIPFRDGQTGQTRPSNLGPLSRRAHRVKTHCGWQLQQPQPGIFKWVTEQGQTFTVGPNGTIDTTHSPP